MQLEEILELAIQHVLKARTDLKLPCGSSSPPGAQPLLSFLETQNFPVEVILAEASLIVWRASTRIPDRTERNSLQFMTPDHREERTLLFTDQPDAMWALRPDAVLQSVVAANSSIERIHDLSLVHGVDLFAMLGLRNLSAFVGEVFAKELQLIYATLLIKNPNQDGYPDLCALTPSGKAYIQQKATINGRLAPNKDLWSPYPHGGIEVKATCGNTPAASKIRKPLIGETRLAITQTAEWKAHHQQTRILLGLYWDFVDSLPTVLAAFFRNDLDTTPGPDNSDWGAIIQPNEEGGRTTSVSIMKRGTNSSSGVKKMGQGWVVLPTHQHLLAPICRVFHVPPATLPPSVRTAP